MVAERVTKSSGAPTPTKTSEGGAEKTSKADLAGKTFAEQEALLTPEENQRPVITATTTEAAPPVAAAAASTAPPLTADQLVISREPNWAKSEFVGWFRDTLKAKVEGWGLASDARAVSLANDGGTNVIALNWNSAWGSKPTTRELGMKMNPLDAKAAVTGVHALSGWGSVDGTAQGQLDALLGGETNLLSETARNNLSPKFKGLGAKPADVQSATLTGIIGAKEAVPYLADEAVASKPAVATIPAPTEDPAYGFRGGNAPALVYAVTFDDGTKVTVVAPKAPDAAMHYHTVEQAVDAASYLPSKSRATINTVVLNTQVNPDDAYWAVQYATPDFHSYMTAGGAGVVHIYPDKVAPPSANVMRGSMIHETGHAWSYQTWGNDTTKGGWATWKAAMDSDKVSVSGYAMNDIAEDVAETVRVYGATKGTPKYDEYKAIIPKRIDILEKELA